MAESWSDRKRSQIGPNMRNRGSCSWDLQVRSEPGHERTKGEDKSFKENPTGKPKGSWNRDRGLVLTAATSRVVSE